MQGSIYFKIRTTEQNGLLMFNEGEQGTVGIVQHFFREKVLNYVFDFLLIGPLVF